MSYPSYPGYPDQGGGGYPSYPGYPGSSAPQPGYDAQPQPQYPSYPGYPDPSQSQPQPGYPGGSYPGYPGAGSSYPSYPGAGPAQPGFPAAPDPSGYPQPSVPTYPSYPAYPSQPGGYPAPAPSYPGYPGFPAASGGGGYPAYPGYPFGGPPPDPVPIDDLPEDYQSSVSFLQENQQENLTESGRVAFQNLAGEDGEIDAFELQEILNTIFKREFDIDGFSIDVTRSMVALRDYDMSGKLDFEDFRLLWSDLMICKKAFKELDTDGNGYFDRNEFANAFKNLGLHVNERTQRALTMRYSDREGKVKFNDFVASYVRLKTMLKTFLTKDLYQQGNVEFEIDEYIQMCMYS